MSDTTLQIRLKAVRAQAGLSLAQAAERTGVSKAMLGQIERGESSPTIATLWKLSKGFRQPLSAFLHLAPQDGQPPVPVSFPGEITVQTVFPFDPLYGSETFLITLEPGQAHVSQPHAPGVVEDVVVTAGQIEVLQGEAWAVCPPAKGLRFAADQLHGYRNDTSEPAQFLNVMHYPTLP